MVLKQLLENSKEINSFIADFSYTSVQGNTKISYTGVLYYKKPNLIKLKFAFPKDQQIILNGKELYVYLPNLDVVLKKIIKGNEETEGITSLYPTSLNRLKAMYNFTFPADGYKFENGYIFYLIPTVPTNYKWMKIWVQENGLIRKIEAETLLKETVSLTLTYTKINVPIPMTEFVFITPATSLVLTEVLE